MNIPGSGTDQLIVMSHGHQYAGPLEVVLVDAGEFPGHVAALLRSLMSLTLLDPAALFDATPLVLYQSLSAPEAEWIRRQLEAAGASVELRVPREPAKGLRRTPVPNRAA